MIISFKLRTELLFACASHFCKERSYLNGVQISSRNKQLYYVGTSGKSLLCCRDSQNKAPKQDMNIIISIADIMMIKKIKSLPKVLDLEFDNEKQVILACAYFDQFKLIDGCYPQWRKLLPEKLTDRTIQPLTQHVLDAFAKSLRALGNYSHFQFYNGVTKEDYDIQLDKPENAPKNVSYFAYFNEDIIGIAMGVHSYAEILPKMLTTLDSFRDEEAVSEIVF